MLLLSCDGCRTGVSSAASYADVLSQVVEFVHPVADQPNRGCRRCRGDSLSLKPKLGFSKASRYEVPKSSDQILVLVLTSVVRYLTSQFQQSIKQSKILTVQPNLGCSDISRYEVPKFSGPIGLGINQRG